MSRFWDVLPLAVEQGKKIRRKTWREGVYWVFKEYKPAGKILTSYSTGCDLGSRVKDVRAIQIDGDDWEIMPDENPFPEGSGRWAAWWMAMGRYVTRGDGGLHYTQNAVGNLLCRRGGGELFSPSASTFLLATTDWRLSEVYEENPHEEGTGPWAAWWLERGGYITRDCWGGMKATRRADGSIRVIDERNLVTNYSLTAHDLAATDWQLVEED